jgi:SAM-dependent methyltransferase
LISRRGSYQDYDDPNKNDPVKMGFASSAEFFKRYKGHVDFKDKTVLDVGCARGSTCYYVVLNGAAQAVGVDIRKEAVSFAQSRISENPTWHNRVAFKLLSDLNGAQFDIVLSKDSFEHYENPEKFISFLKDHVKPGGKIVIGFSPLWKSPYGGHLWTLSRWPWIHLVFPESAIMTELRRYYKDDSAQSYRDVATGLNKMTLSRFNQIVKENGLKVEYLEFNVSSQRKSMCILTLFKGLRLIPGLKEYFTVSVYSILQIKGSP